MTDSVIHTEHSSTHPDVFSKTVVGFWIYLMTDCMLFGCLFATYGVLHHNTYGGPALRDIFNGPYVLIETLILLISSFTCGLALLAAYLNKKNQCLILFAVTFLLGFSFVFMEVNEFVHLVKEGNSWQRSGFLSAFFTLVGTHGTHISFGLVWMLVMMGQLFFRGIKAVNLKRLVCLSMFWHFLDLVWIFIFTCVYLMGA